MVIVIFYCDSAVIFVATKFLFMKKIYLLLCANFFVVSIVNAQITKGSLWLGGNVGFSSAKNGNGENSKTSSYSISPSIGIAVKQNTIIGVLANFTHYHFQDSFSDQVSSSQGGAIFLRQYWQIISRFYAFGHFAAGYTYSNQTNETQNTKNEVKGWTVGLSASPGIAFSANRWFQLEAWLSNLFNVSYSNRNYKTTSSSSQSSYDSHSITSGINLDNAGAFNLGVRFLIKR
jgi:hypothetical protein